MEKAKKILIIIVSLIIICWLTIFITDFIRSNSLKPPIFAFAGMTTNKDGGSGNYQGLGYNVEVKKRMDVEYGVQIISVEMYIFGKLIAASIE